MVIKEKKAQVQLNQLATIEGDELMLLRLFDNLLSNALKYVEDGVVPTITISGISKEDHIEITVTDNGIGFGEQFVPQIFTLFQRLHAREKFAGTGLGLAICRKIAEMHVGSITSMGEVNKGSTFSIQLPFKQK